jgi:anti-sigma factor RsiW
MRDDHIGEYAELYALGELDEPEAARVERHAGECAECAKRLGHAETTVLQLIESAGAQATPESLDRRVRFAAPNPPARGWIAAVAAAFLIGLLPWGWSATQHRDEAQPAIDAMLAGHFTHAPLLPLVAGAPVGKVIYAREGGWIYVLAGSGAVAVDVATVAAGKATLVATLAPSSATRAAFVRIAARIDAVELMENGKPVATARVVYAR